mgnify:CR=1 FL=1
MHEAKAVNLRVRPFKSVDLCYPVSGIICAQPDLLGQKVRRFPVHDFYTRLSETDGSADRLKWGSRQIHEHFFLGETPGAPGVSVLSHLRNVSEAADLDSALLMRQNAYLTSYSSEVLEEVQRVYNYDPGDAGAARHTLLVQAERDLTSLYNGLDSVYKKRGLWGKVVVKTRSDQDNAGVQFMPGGDVYFDGASHTLTSGYEYRYPSVENDLRYHQARAAIRQEILNAQRMRIMCEHGGTTFPNEVSAIDLRIRKLQSDYIDTILTSPIDGTVTGVFRTLGDFIQAGEPVLRVEDDEGVYLVGTIKCRAMVRPGGKYTLTARLFEAAGAVDTDVQGEVVTVRGHDAVSEQWDILALCENRTPGGVPILPINYHFDFESTSILVS